MDISILTCPQCNAMVLSDAGRCHVCDHVLDQARDKREEIPVLPTDDAVAEDLDTCAKCGETYRKGLVRCWNCGAFTREEIEAAYKKMSADPERYTAKEVSPSDELAPEATQRSGPWRVSAAPPVSSPPPLAAEEEFDASDEDFSFELADSVQLTESQPATHDEYEEAAPVYQFAAPLAAEVDAAPTEIPSLPVTPTAEEVVAPAAVAPTEKRPAQDVPAVAHSEATAGDVLLNIALEEEKDLSKSRKTYAARIRGGFIVYCPMGCRIRVQERHRGKAGKCPKCHSVFFVPRARSSVSKAEGAEPEAAAPKAVEKWRGQLVDVRLHTVIPTKLRIKPDSLLNEFTPVDIVFSQDGMLLSTLVANAGFLGANLKKKPALRSALEDHLKSAGTVEGAPGAQHTLIPMENLSQLAVAQPSPADVESIFGNIPVFGAGRIAVRLPRSGDDAGTQYLSFSLSEFRSFVKSLDEVCGIAGLGADTEVPLTETYNTVPCHYSESPVRELLAIEYYQKDPQIKLKEVGWRCGGCGLVVSEDSRKKEKIGGLNGKGIASAKCPKCSAKFGKNPMYEIESATVPTPSTPEPVAT